MRIIWDLEAMHELIRRPLGGNWEWRMKPGEPDEGTVREMERMTKIYGRLRFT